MQGERVAVQPLDVEGAKAWLARFKWGDAVVGRLLAMDEGRWLDMVNGMRLSFEGQFDKDELSMLGED